MIGRKNKNNQRIKLENSSVAKDPIKAAGEMAQLLSVHVALT